MVPGSRAHWGVFLECSHPHAQVGPPGGLHRQPRAVYKHLGKDDVVDVSMIMQLEFQQSKYETAKVPQIQFVDRLPDVPVVTQRWVLTVQTVQKTGDSTHAVCCGRRSCAWSDKFQRSHRQGHHGLEWMLPHFCSFFRTLSGWTSSALFSAFFFWSPRWPTVVDCRGLGFAGVAGNFTPRHRDCAS